MLLAHHCVYLLAFTDESIFVTLAFQCVVHILVQSKAIFLGLADHPYVLIDHNDVIFDTDDHVLFVTHISVQSKAIHCTNDNHHENVESTIHVVNIRETELFHQFALHRFTQSKAMSLWSNHVANDVIVHHDVILAMDQLFHSHIFVQSNAIHVGLDNAHGYVVTVHDGEILDTVLFILAVHIFVQSNAIHIWYNHVAYIVTTNPGVTFATYASHQNHILVQSNAAHKVDDAIVFTIVKFQEESTLKIESHDTFAVHMFHVIGGAIVLVFNSIGTNIFRQSYQYKQYVPSFLQQE